MNLEITIALKKVSEEFYELLKNLTEQQLNNVPFPESWTPAQIGEHILKSNPYSVLEGETSETKRLIDEQCQTQQTPTTQPMNSFSKMYYLQT
jgi:hypothetical protein